MATKKSGKKKKQPASARGKSGIAKVKGSVSKGTYHVVKKGDSKKKSKKATASVIGSFAGLEFRVNVKKDGSLDILTPADMGQEVSSNWTEHEIIGRKYPKSEFLGANNRSFNMTIVIDRLWGHSPLGTMKKLSLFCEKGKVDVLKIGSHKVGTKWKIDSISQAWNAVYHEGQLVKATVTLTLSHYS